MNREQLQDIFRQPYNAQTWQELLINLFGASEIRQTPSTLTSDSNEKVEGFELGRLYTGDRYEIGLFAFEIKHGHNVQLNRVGLRSLVRSYTRYNVDAALVVYYDTSHWRLSFICDIKEQKTAPKRYTYVFGNPNESYRTASAMLAKLSDGKLLFENIKSAFSVEALSKDFFKGYKEQYGKFCKYIGGEQKWQRDYVKKMMGRLVFLQFLQKKGWMGCGAAQADWTDGDLQYTQNLIKRYEGNEKLLSDILEPLFFDTLNTKREGDIVDLKLGDNIKIPYLNGGLFDQDKLDEKEIDFPYSYFAELMDFFSQYNFTIDENDPNDAEVGIDPEMLGHIFENLLEDNKDKGAFYTPKEIVQYMCRQSLIEYLQSKLGKHTEIENFINHHDTGNRLDAKNYIVANAKSIEELLDCVKICDPAIGSGAFPMGILNEIFQAKMALDMTLDRATVKKNIIQNSIYGVDIEQGAVDIARLRFWLSLVVDESEPQPLPNLDYKIMCGNSLLSRYALDMPLEDVFKEYNKGKSEPKRMSLAKYKQLLADYTNTSDHIQKAGFRKTIEDIKSAFRTELGRGEKVKLAKLKGQITDLEAPMLFGERTKKEKEDLKKLKIKFAKQEQEQADIVNNKLYEDAFEWRFEFPQLLDDDGNFVGFDIVIANPPYVFARDSKRKGITAEDKKYYYNHFHLAKYQINLYHLFVELGTKILTDSGVFVYIIPNNWLTINTNKAFREFVLSKSNVQVVNFYKRVFETADVDSSILLFENSKNNLQIKLFEATEKEKIEIVKETSCKFFLDKTDFIINIESFKNSLFSNLLDKIEQNSVELRNFADVKAGLQAYEVGKANPACTVDMKDTRIYHSRVKESVDYYKYLQGIDVCRYSLNWSGEYLKYGVNLAAPRTFNLYSSPRILVRQIPSKPPYCINACFTDEVLLNDRNSMNIINIKCNPLYVLGMLNSRAVSFWFIHKFGKMQRGLFPQFKINELQIFPIPKISETNQQPIIDIVDKILEAKKADTKADTTALEAQIDTMVYAIYGLTYDEILTIAPQ